MSDPRQTSTRRHLIHAAWPLGSGATPGGMALPRLLLGGPTTRAQADDTAPTQTREAELAELHALRAEVAEPNVCTPPEIEAPVPVTATATPVPPAATA